MHQSRKLPDAKDSNHRAEHMLIILSVVAFFSMAGIYFIFI